MKTLNLKTPDITEGLVILEDCDIIEILGINDGKYNYSSNLQKVVSDTPFQIYNNSNVLITTTTEFISDKAASASYFKIKGTEINQIIYIKHFKEKIKEQISVESCRIIKLSATTNVYGFRCLIEDIPHSLKSLSSFETIDITLDLSTIKGGSDAKLVIENTNLKLLDISKIADTFNYFYIYNCYVGDINIVDYFANKTYSTIILQNSDFIGDVCNLVERYFNNNKFLTFTFFAKGNEVTLYNKPLLSSLTLYININESGAIIKRKVEETYETILTYNGSTWEGSWTQ